MGSTRKSVEHYKQLATNVHGGQYTYELWTDFITVHTKNIITCKTHGTFMQSIGNHIFRKAGCPHCRSQAIKLGFNKKSLQYWIDKSNNIHQNKYDYSLLVDHKTSENKVSIICPDHGVFQQVLAEHANGHECKQCANVTRRATNIKKYGMHPKRRHYSNDVLDKLNDKDWLIDQHINQQKSLAQISIELRIGGTTVGRFWKKCGMATQRHPTSIGEKSVCEFVSTLAPTTFSDRLIIAPQELDIVVPTHKLAIEYCGLYWHGEKHKPSHYHQSKFNKCKASNIRLITLLEDRWTYRQDAVKCKLVQLLDNGTHPPIPIHLCTVSLVLQNEAQQFFNQYNIDSIDCGSINCGIYHNNILVSCITIVEKNNGIFSVVQYCSTSNVDGGLLELTTHFINSYQFTKLELMISLNWPFDLYPILDADFSQTNKILHSSYWTDGNRRYFNKPQNIKKLWKLQDCDKIKFILTNQKATNDL